MNRLRVLYCDDTGTGWLPTITSPKRTRALTNGPLACKHCGHVDHNGEGRPLRWEIRDGTKYATATMIDWPGVLEPLDKDYGQQFRAFLTKWVKKIPKKERAGHLFVFCRLEQGRNGDYLRVGILHIPQSNDMQDHLRRNLKQKRTWPQARIPKDFPRAIDV